MNRTQIFSPYSHTLSPPHLITFHKGHFRTQMSTPLSPHCPTSPHNTLTMPHFPCNPTFATENMWLLTT